MVPETPTFMKSFVVVSKDVEAISLQLLCIVRVSNEKKGNHSFKANKFLESDLTHLDQSFKQEEICNDQNFCEELSCVADDVEMIRVDVLEDDLEVLDFYPLNLDNTLLHILCFNEVVFEHVIEVLRSSS